MREVLLLDLELAMWLVPDHRYRELASAQKIYYDALSISHDLRLESAFEKLGVSAPTTEQARSVFDSVSVDVAPTYAFEVGGQGGGQIWHIRNQTRLGTFDQNPLEKHGTWVLFIQLGGNTERVVLAGKEVSDALAWLPLLDGHHTTEEIESQLAVSAERRAIGAALNNVGAFVVAEEEAFASGATLPELLFMSHSSVLIRGHAGGTVLIDPAFLPSTEILSREGRRPFEIVSHVDAVVVSHCHWDHLSFQTMIRIPRDTTIYVPKSTTPPALVNPPIRRYLEAFGFTDVREVTGWDTTTVGEKSDIEITFVPFFGEPFGLASRFDAFTYLVRANGKTVFGSLDACHDEAGTMDPIIEQLATIKPPDGIDVFLFGSSAYKHDPIYRAANIRHYSNELTTRPDMVRYHPNIDDVLRWSSMLRPKALVPYANFVYFGSQQHEDIISSSTTTATNIDGYWSGEHIPKYALPWKSELERLAQSQPAPVVMLHPMQGLRT